MEEDQPGAVDMETLLKGVCAKANFLDLVENFIVFDDFARESRKILARNYQYLGVNRAVEARSVPANAEKGSWGLSGIPRVRERAIPWCSLPARFIANWGVTSPS